MGNTLTKLKKIENIIQKIDNKIVVKRQIHERYLEFKKIGDEIICPFGKYKYIYSSNRGKICLIKLAEYLYGKRNCWEIYCFEGDLSDDVERFSTKKEAEKRIFGLLK